jgi:hypothetical protein
MFCLLKKISMEGNISLLTFQWSCPMWHERMHWIWETQTNHGKQHRIKDEIIYEFSTLCYTAYHKRKKSESNVSMKVIQKVPAITLLCTHFNPINTTKSVSLKPILLSPASPSKSFPYQNSIFTVVPATQEYIRPIHWNLPDLTTSPIIKWKV